jgi:hypothetical protein
MSEKTFITCDRCGEVEEQFNGQRIVVLYANRHMINTPDADRCDLCADCTASLKLFLKGAELEGE